MIRHYANRAAHYPYLSAQYAVLLVNSFPASDDDDFIWSNELSAITCANLPCSKKFTKKSCIELLSFEDPYPEQSSQLKQNILNVLNLFEIDPKFAQVLEFVILMNTNPGLAHVFNYLEIRDTHRELLWLFGDLTGMDSTHIYTMIRSLGQQGLFEVAERYTCITELTINSALVTLLTTQLIKTKEDLLQPLLHQSPASHLKLKDFSYVDTTLLQSFIKEAVRQKHKGVNLLIHGSPGTGKTELSRALAAALGMQLFDVRVEPSVTIKHFARDESRNISLHRFQQLRLTQNLLGGSRQALLLIDECESLFYMDDISYTKEDLHRLLETNPVPSIWITNHIETMEPSHIRRFKLVVEMDGPDKHTLLTISDKVFKGLGTSSDFRQRLTETANLTPAIISNTSYVAQTIGAKKREAEAVIEAVMESTLVACNEWESPMNYQQEMPFDKAFLNIRQPASMLKEIAYAIKHHEPIRVLISGPPGTGKTAFAHALANEHQIALNRIKCSDVLSKYVGESEKNVQKIFYKAHRARHMLLLDEVDSLLTSRERLTAHHQLQLVNELLAQLECFTQPLFAATNYASLLDAAVLRRFDFKLDCDYLTAEQVCTLYKRSLGVQALTKAEQQALSVLKCLTPGDFAILARKMRFLPKQDHRASAIPLLTEENQRKQPTATIGFVH